MTDPTALLDEIAAAEDAFGHAQGRPEFEPELNSSTDASDGEVQIQKACRLLELTQNDSASVREVSEFYDFEAEPPASRSDGNQL